MNLKFSIKLNFKRLSSILTFILLKIFPKMTSNVIIKRPSKCWEGKKIKWKINKMNIKLAFMRDNFPIFFFSFPNLKLTREINFYLSVSILDIRFSPYLMKIVRKKIKKNFKRSGEKKIELLSHEYVMNFSIKIFYFPC